MIRALFFAFLLLFVGATFATHSKKPWFCHDHDCPTFTNLTKEGQKFEIREYEEARWVSVSIETYHFRKDIQESLVKLFEYMGGKNSEKEVIDMGVPIAISIKHPEKKHHPSNITISIYLPNKYQIHRRPPLPSDSQIVIKESPKVKVAVLCFGGYALEEEILDKVGTLTKELERAKLSYENSLFVFALYDSPFHFTHRHNEVWLKLKDK